jgi:hypothetical protein
MVDVENRKSMVDSKNRFDFIQVLAPFYLFCSIVELDCTILNMKKSSVHDKNDIVFPAQAGIHF